MRAHDTLRQLCARHGLDEAFGVRLLPLLERAQAATPEVRERLLELVEQSLRREAARRLERSRERRGQEEAALLSVARALHGWNPPDEFDPERHGPSDLRLDGPRSEGESPSDPE
jgi:hypothetical protein